MLANEFIFGGVLDRFERLKLVLSEYEVCWLPYWLKAYPLGSGSA